MPVGKYRNFSPILSEGDVMQMTTQREVNVAILDKQISWPGSDKMIYTGHARTENTYLVAAVYGQTVAF